MIEGQGGKRLGHLGVTGDDGDLVFREMPDGSLVVSSAPKKKRRSSKAQKAYRNGTFKDRTQWAKWAQHAYPIYAELAAGRPMVTAYNMAISDAAHPPVIQRLLRRDGRILVQAWDEVMVAGVRVTVRDAAGQLLESGNACQVENRVVESPGVDPCPELPIRATVWQIPAFRTNQTQGDGRRFAKGLRNMVALDINPRNGRLYGVQNGRDQLAELWPQIFTPAQDLVLPSEELFRIDLGADYGWPDYGYGRNNDSSPMGNPNTPGIEPAFLVWIPGITPSGLLFYTGDAFPAWKDNLLVGSIVRGRTNGETGVERVVFNDMERMWEVRRETFLEELKQRIRDVRQGPDGLIYLLTQETDGMVLKVEPATAP